MHRCVLFAASLLLALIGRPADTHAQSPDLDLPNNFATHIGEVSTAYQALARAVHPAVVQIVANRYSGLSATRGAGGAQLTEQRSTGSGVFLDSLGHIVTNAHVVRDAHEVFVRRAPPLRGAPGAQSVLPPQRAFIPARVIGADAETDLAVLKIEDTGSPYLPLGNSERLRPGEVVFAFGSPLGLENSVSMGVVSATARQLQPEDPMIYIQTDAPINPGSSGGPLVNADGEVVGINTLNLSQSGGSEGLGFAAPSNIVRNIFRQIRDQGYVRRGVIGVHAQTLTPDLAEGLQMNPNHSVILGDVYPNSPAAQAGLQPGDVVTHLDGKPLENARQLDVNLYGYPIGSSATLTIQRDAQTLTRRVRVVERSDSRARFARLATPEDHLVESLGILGVTVRPEVRRLLPTLRFDTGVVVAASSGSPSLWGNRLQPGDVIFRIADRRVRTLQDLRQALLMHDDTRILVAQVQRGPTLQYLTFGQLN